MAAEARALNRKKMAMGENKRFRSVYRGRCRVPLSVLSTHVFKLANCIATVLINGSGVFLQNPRSLISDYLADE